VASNWCWEELIQKVQIVDKETENVFIGNILCHPLLYHMFANNEDNESETAKPIKMIVVGDRKTLLVNMHMTNRLVHIVIMVTNGLSITSHSTLISRIQYCESHVIFSDSTRLYKFDAAKHSGFKLVLRRINPESTNSGQRNRKCFHRKYTVSSFIIPHHGIPR
jgi:hypothetical protein